MGMNKDPTDKDLTAISWDDRQIRLRALTSSRQVPWQSVESVQTVRRVVRANFVVTVAKSYEMVFRLRHNGSRRKVKINAGALTISPIAAGQLVQLAPRRAQAGNYSMGTNDTPDFGSRKAANGGETDAVFGRDAAERLRSFGAKDQATVARLSLGRKVV